MSIFGSLFGNNNTSSTSRTQLEGPAKDAVIDLIGRTTDFANQPYTPYTYPREADFNQTQNWAFGNATDIAGRAGGLFGDLQGAVYRGAQYGEGVLDPAMAGIFGQNNMLAGESGIRAGYGDQIAGQAQTMAGQGANILGQSLPGTAALAQRFPDAPIADYMNPYVQQVLDPAMRDLERRSEQERLNLTDRAIQTGSFGGSRNAIAQGMQQRSAMEEMGRLSANERAKAFNEASNQFRLDQQRIPELYNQMFGQIGAAQNLGRNAQQMNSQTIADRGQAIQQGLGAQQSAQNLANLQNLRYGQMSNLLEANQNLLGSQVNPLLATGGLQQAMQQANLDTMYSDFVEQRDWDKRGIDALIRTLGLAAPTSQTTSSQTTGPRPNALGQVIGATTGLIGAIGPSNVASGVNWLSNGLGIGSIFRKGGMVRA
jgi:hypothetical protein